MIRYATAGGYRYRAGIGVKDRGHSIAYGMTVAISQLRCADGWDAASAGVLGDTDFLLINATWSSLPREFP